MTHYTFYTHVEEFQRFFLPINPCNREKRRFREIFHALFITGINTTLLLVVSKLFWRSFLPIFWLYFFWKDCIKNLFFSVRWIGRKLRHGKIKESHQSQPKPKGSPKWYSKTKEVCLQANVLEGCWSKSKFLNVFKYNTNF